MPNRLAREKSPYLLQHKDNPVDWYPWGTEAFERAEADAKPIFLSIGYATCHWCHVMERESFEDAGVAAFLNDHFVSVKVDREERPDVDDVYMNVVQALTGSGGWPVTVFMTPQGKPFFAGTYFPHPARLGRPGFLDLLRHVQGVWAERRENLIADAETVTEEVRKAFGAVAGAPEQQLEPSMLELGYDQLHERFDEDHAGFGDAMKFPTPHNVSFLLRFAARERRPAPRELAERTLDAIWAGGLRDHLGGGFHRYCVDPAWTIPHFEKMLYDQAGLVRAFAEAYQVTGHARYADAVRETLDFVLRDMTHPEGAFTSAWDADSEGEEGKFYVWTPSEIRAVLGDDDGDLFCARYGVTEHGNFPELPGTTHLRLVDTLDDAITGTGLSPEAAEAKLLTARQQLLAARNQRPAPLHDDKVLTDWNGLMIGAAAVAARALDEPRFAEAAGRAATFLLQTMRPDGVLLHRYRDGEAAIPGLLDDYAFLAWGLLELYEATFEPRWLAWARTLAREMLKRFWDAERGGLFLSPEDTELFHRSKPVYDGAVPSGNAVAATVLLRLGVATGSRSFLDKGAATLDSYAGLLRKLPGSAGTHALQALDLLLGPTREVVIAGDLGDAAVQSMVRAVNARFLPKTLLLHRPREAEEIVALAPFVEAQVAQDGRATAYVCRDYACQRPVHDAEALAAQLDAL